MMRTPKHLTVGKAIDFIQGLRKEALTDANAAAAKAAIVVQHRILNRYQALETAALERLSPEDRARVLAGLGDT